VPRVRWLLLILLLCCSSAKANQPLVTNRCSNPNTNSNFLTNTAYCFLQNVTAGNTVVFGISATTTSGVPGTTTLSFAGSTETPTCPANSKADQIRSGSDDMTQLCYIVLASSHSTLIIKATVSGGSNPFFTSMAAREYQGLGSFDSGSAANANATLSLNVTTANASEIIYTYCSDSSVDLSSGSANVLGEQMTTAKGVGGGDWRGFAGYRIAGAASTYAMSCTTTTSLPAQEIVGFAFQQSSPPAVPSPVNIVQECSFSNSVGGSTNGSCSLSNTTAGNTIVISATMRGALTTADFSPQGTETPTCVAGTFGTHSYSGQTYSTTICYVVAASSHTAFLAGILAGPGPFVEELLVYEVSGLTSVDTGSAAFCAATTCNYTTLNSGEWTAFIAGDTFNTAGPTFQPGNSFLPVGWIKNDSSLDVGHALVGAKITSSSGSNTASYTLTGSATPVMATLSFGTSLSSVAKKKSYIM